LDYVTRHVNQQTPQNLPIYRQNYIIYIIERDMFKPSQGVIHVNDEDLAHSAANPGCSLDNESG